jgi:hypothetical protein
MQKIMKNTTKTLIIEILVLTARKCEKLGSVIVNRITRKTPILS